MAKYFRECTLCAYNGSCTNPCKPLRIPRAAKKPQRLGKALTILARHQVNEQALHDDVDAFGAPGECHTLVSRNEHRRERQARKHAEAVAGMPERLIRRKARKLGFDERAFSRLFFALDAKYGFPG